VRISEKSINRKVMIWTNTSAQQTFCINLGVVEKYFLDRRLPLSASGEQRSEEQQKITI